MLSPLRARVIRGLLKFPPRDARPLRWARTGSVLTPDDLAELQRLSREGLAVDGPHGWTLTPRGRTVANVHGLMDTANFVAEDADLGAAPPPRGRIPASRALPRAVKPKTVPLAQDADGQMRLA